MAVRFSIRRLFFRVYKETNKLRGNKNWAQFLQTNVSLMDGLNNLTLNNSMLASLYGHSLVNLNEKSVLVVTKAKLTASQQQFLMQILQACKLSNNDVAILNTADKKIPLEQAISNSSPKYILSFGTGDGTELFTMANNEGRKYLNAPALEEM